jgi:hypothetical protein
MDDLLYKLQILFFSFQIYFGINVSILINNLTLILVIGAAAHPNNCLFFGCGGSFSSYMDVLVETTRFQVMHAR